MIADPLAVKLVEAAHELVRRDQCGLAWDAVQLALAVDAGVANAHMLKAHLLELRGEVLAALPHWRAAARLEPGMPGHRFNLALALLGCGMLTEGFALQEARLEKPDWNSLAAAGSFAGLRHRVPGPLDDLTGKRVLAFTEQGMGDMLWAARFLPALAERCAKLDLACPPTLRPVLAHVAHVAPGGLLGPPEDQPAAKLNMAALSEQYDAFVPMMSLPNLLGGAGAVVPWLRPDARRVTAWRERFAVALPGRRPIVGVVWRANPASNAGAARTFPPSVLGSLGRAGAVNLQGGGSIGRDALAGAFDPLAAGDVPLDEYAAMLAATDLLISADTMAAHLAGSMGHPTWVVVPRVANFYWGHTGTGSPWYPGSRVFRQADKVGWTDVGAAITRALASLEPR